MKSEPWRTESDISNKRKEELKKCRATPTDSNKGIYAFSGVKLNRADIEWLLATHENEHGPVLWDKEGQRGRKGLDLRGADLRGNGSGPVDLSKLPLARLIAGPVTLEERAKFTGEQDDKALIQLKGISFRGANLEGANFYKANLTGIDLREAKLEKADLSGAQLNEAKLIGAQLESAVLRGAQLEKAELRYALLNGADLCDALLNGADLRYVRLKKVDLSDALLNGAKLGETLLESVNFSRAIAVGADLSGARLENTNLSGAVLEGANLSGVQLKEVDLSQAKLARTNLKGAVLESVKLEEVVLTDEDGVGPFLADVQWGNTNLAVVDWSRVTRLGEAQVVRQRNKDGIKKPNEELLKEYRAATRANRQLAVALQGQGLNEDAIPFAYAANAMQRRVFWYQLFDNREQRGGKAPKTRWARLKGWFDTKRRKILSLLSYLFSHFLNLLAGYGYYPILTLWWYVFTIAVFAGIYACYGQGQAKISLWPNAVVLSFLAFHGRGFFPGINGTDLNTALVKFSAVEAVVGLLIELSFVATFTQRFFGK